MQTESTSDSKISHPITQRRLLGEGRIVGLSTHSVKQALEANRAPVDYIAIGPVFGTSTKENPGAVAGLQPSAKSGVKIEPLVAIGGITLALAASVSRAGDDSIAVISDLFATAISPNALASSSLARNAEGFLPEPLVIIAPGAPLCLCVLVA